MQTHGPSLNFYRLVAGARPPCRADSLADGTLPLRAVRRCDALTTASGFGGWIFPALDVWLLRDGHPILWSADGEVQSAAGPRHLPARLRRLGREGSDGSGARSAAAVPDQPARAGHVADSHRLAGANRAGQPIIRCQARSSISTASSPPSDGSR